MIRRRASQRRPRCPNRTAAAAVQRLVAGEAGIFTALVTGVVAALPLEQVLTPKPPPDPDLVKLATLLAR